MTGWRDVGKREHCPHARITGKKIDEVDCVCPELGCCQRVTFPVGANVHRYRLRVFVSPFYDHAIGV